MSEEVEKHIATTRRRVVDSLCTIKKYTNSSVFANVFCQQKNGIEGRRQAAVADQSVATHLNQVPRNDDDDDEIIGVKEASGNSSGGRKESSMSSTQSG